MENYNQKAQEILKTLTLEEKAKLFSGKNYWFLHDIVQHNIPSIMMTDGPHGVRKEIGTGAQSNLSNTYPSTCFPTACLTACSFDPNLLEQMGIALGNECIANDVSVLLGPGINHKRSPLCGRNFEYFSEDPILSGRLGASFVRGVQSMGVGTSLKHYACNNQENYRMISDSIIDERTLREIYLKAFNIVVKEAEPWTIMNSYNKINGTFTCENKFLLQDILRKEWGYNGVVVTDWGALDDPIASIKNGCNLEMPGTGADIAKEIVAAVNKNKLQIEEVDKVIIKNIELMLKCIMDNKKEFDKNYIDNNINLAKRIATESIVLLKNEDNILPIRKVSDTYPNIALIGELATVSRYQGSGSSLINPRVVDSVFEALQKDNIPYKFAYGYKDNVDDNELESLMEEAKELAKCNDLVICVVGLPPSYESEGFDRTSLELPKEQNKLVKELTKINNNVIVVLQCGSVVSLPWFKQVKGVLLSYLGGCQVGQAIKEIMFGKVNPSGKLAETWPYKLKDTPCYNYYSNDKYKTLYKEALYTGYRYYDSANIPVQFPFGYGLSYSNFEYHDFKIINKKDKYFEDDEITITGTITNNSDVTGKEIVQIYIGKCDSIAYRPLKELKAFQKTELKSNSSSDVTFVITKKDLEFYNEIIGKWDIEVGKYKIYICSSCSKVEKELDFMIINTNPNNEIVPGSFDVPSVYYYPNQIQSVSDSDFEALIKRKIPEYKITHPYNLNTTIGELRDSFMGRRVYNIILKMATKLARSGDTKNMMDAMLNDLPLRSMSMGGSAISRRMIYGIIDLSNGKIFRGLWKIITK